MCIEPISSVNSYFKLLDDLYMNISSLLILLIVVRFVVSLYSQLCAERCILREKEIY